MNLTDRDERTASAGEYVLGTLSAEERLAFEAALTTDAGRPNGLTGRTGCSRWPTRSARRVRRRACGRASKPVCRHGPRCRGPRPPTTRAGAV